MRTGRLRRRLTLQQKTSIRDAAGGVNNSWSDVTTVWGGVEPLTGREYLAAQATQNEEEVRIVIRYYKGIDSTWRIKDATESPQVIYTIHSIRNENTRNRMLILNCRQGAESG